MDVSSSSSPLSSSSITSSNDISPSSSSLLTTTTITTTSTGTIDDGKKQQVIRDAYEKQVEPILQENPKRFSLFPIHYVDLWELYREQSKSMWDAGEVSEMTADCKDWVSLKGCERDFIKKVLAFFANADTIVSENLVTRFATEVQIPEARAFYAMQNAIEAVHAETYNLQLDALIDNQTEKMRLFAAIENYPCVKRKAEWALKWMYSETASFASRLLAFLCVEGIFFSGSFCAIFWLKSRGLMTQGLCHANEMIARDETLHCKFACKLYEHLRFTKLSNEEVQTIVKEAVEIEKEFIRDALAVDLIGMNSQLMSQYIEFVADYWLEWLYVPVVYHATNPFKFMEMLTVRPKTNFFEKKVGEYSKAEIAPPLNLTCMADIDRFDF